ncbi:MAG TPA: hypothetical protein VMM60_16255, partial [Ilumatobacter sp.]|nr:hypothetical protein [Ilumatobacter sp.]
STMGHTRWNESLLSPTPARLIVARMLNNLRSTCEQRNDAVRLAIVMQLRIAMPEFAGEEQSTRHAMSVFN